MSLPPAIKTVTVTFGRRFNLDGMTAVLAGTFELDQDLLWAATGDVLQKEATPASFDPETGLLSFEFPACDQTGFEDGQGNAVTNFRGILRATVNGRPIPALPFQVFEADMPGPVDLDFFVASSLVPGAVAQTTYVRSVGGLSGAVGLDTLADALAPYLPSPTPQDTGWRDITATDILGGDNGHLRRIGDRVYLNLNPDQNSIDSDGWTALPTGFRGTGSTSTYQPTIAVDDTGLPVGAIVAKGSNGNLFGAKFDGSPLTFAVGIASWLTDDTFPAPGDYPGTPVVPS